MPFLSAGNWGGLGLHLRGNVIAYEQAASKQKWLEMHTDTHFASMYLAEAVALQKRFFDHFLKGEENGFEREPPVLLTIRDPRGFVRRKESEWPLARTAVGALRARCVRPCRCARRARPRPRRRV